MDIPVHSFPSPLHLIFSQPYIGIFGGRVIHASHSFKEYQIQLTSEFGKYAMKKGYRSGTVVMCCATNRKVAGLIPDGVIGIFH